MGQPQHDAILRPDVVGLIQVVYEHEVGHLLHHVQRVGDAPGPEDLPKAVDLVFQLAGNHGGFLLAYLQCDVKLSILYFTCFCRKSK